MALSQAEVGPHNSGKRASEFFDYHVMGRRIVAALIDLVLLIVLYFIIGAVAGDVSITTEEFGDSSFESTDYSYEEFASVTLVDGGLPGWLFLLYISTALSYYIVMERVVAATLGKMFMGLTVVKLGSGLYDWKPVLLRNILRIIDGLPIFYLVGFIFVVATPKNRRLGDLAASTLVVRHHRSVKAR